MLLRCDGEDGESQQQQRLGVWRSCGRGQAVAALLRAAPTLATLQGGAMRPGASGTSPGPQDTSSGGVACGVGRRRSFKCFLKALKDICVSEFGEAHHLPGMSLYT